MNETNAAWALTTFLGSTVTIKSTVPIIENGEYVLEGADDLGLFLTPKSGRAGALYVARTQVVIHLPTIAQAKGRVA